jgi:hypothetical protein
MSIYQKARRGGGVSEKPNIYFSYLNAPAAFIAALLFAREIGCLPSIGVPGSLGNVNPEDTWVGHRSFLPFLILNISVLLIGIIYL